MPSRRFLVESQLCLGQAFYTLVRVLKLLIGHVGRPAFARVFVAFFSGGSLLFWTGLRGVPLKIKRWRPVVWMAQNRDKRAVMGESLAYDRDVILRAAAPQACRFIIVRDGLEVHRVQGRHLDWQPPGPGKYRVQAELFVLDVWLPWVYTNPIELYRL